MASIVQRNKSFSVVYNIYDGDKKKQKWETYHSYEEALHRKEQVEIIYQKKQLKYRSGTLAQFLEGICLFSCFQQNIGMKIHFVVVLKEKMI